MNYPADHHRKSGSLLSSVLRERRAGDEGARLAKSQRPGKEDRGTVKGGCRNSWRIPLPYRGRFAAQVTRWGRPNNFKPLTLIASRANIKNRINLSHALSHSALRLRHVFTPAIHRMASAAYRQCRSRAVVDTPCVVPYRTVLRTRRERAGLAQPRRS